jgi:hypothetical protein
MFLIVGKTVWKIVFRDLGIVGKIILKCTLKKQNV